MRLKQKLYLTYDSTAIKVEAVGKQKIPTLLIPLYKSVYSERFPFREMLLSYSEIILLIFFNLYFAMDISKLKKSLAGFTIFALLTSFVSFAGIAQASTEFDDLDSDHYAYDAIMEMVDLGVMTGDGDANTVRPNDTIQRAEFATMLVRAFVGEDSVDEEYDYGFTDLRGDWSDKYINTAALNELMTGTDGLFSPSKEINRAEGATAAVNAAGVELDGDYEMIFEDVADDTWYYDEVLTAYWYTIVNGKTSTTYEPAGRLTRGQAAMIIFNSLAPELREVTEEEEEEEEVVEGETTLEVTLSDSTPVGDTVPSGANSVAVASWDFEADGGDIEVDGLVVHQYAISSVPSDAAFYIYNGSSRLTSSKTLNSSTRTATFNNLDVVVEDGETTTLTLRMDVGTVSASKEVGFELEDADVVTSDADEVELDGPLQGDKFTLATDSAGSIAINDNGSISNPSVGENGATVAKFTLEPSTEDANVQEIGLYLTGTVSNDDVENFKLYRTGTTEALAEVESVDSNDVVRFVLDGDYDSDDTVCEESVWGYCIEKSESRSFYVTADFNTGRTDDTFKLYLDETTDLVAVGDLYGYGMSVTNGYASGDTSYATLEGGDITMSKTDLAVTDTAVNAGNVTVMEFSIVATADVTFNNFVLQLATGTALDVDPATHGAGLLDGATPNFTDITISEVDGSHVWGPIEADAMTQTVGGTAIDETTDATTAYYLFADDLDMSAGEEKTFLVTLDVENNDDLEGETLTAAVFIDGDYPEIKDSEGTVMDNTVSLVPSTVLRSDEITITANSLAVALDTMVDAETVVLGSDNVAMAAFNFTTGEAGGITVTELTFTGSVDEPTDGNDVLTDGAENFNFNNIVTAIRLYEGSIAEENLIEAAKSAGADGVVAFESMSWGLEADTTTKLIVAADFDSLDDYDEYVVKIDMDAADVNAEDSGGSVLSSVSGGADINDGAVKNGAVMTMTDGGTLTVSIPSSTPRSEIVVAGATEVEFSTLKLVATEESFNVTELRIDDIGTASYENIDKVYVRYYTDDEQTVSETTECPSGTAGIWNCTGLNIRVPDPDLAGAPDYAYVDVLANIKVSSDIDAGDQPELTLTVAHDFEATGEDSGKKLLQGDITTEDLDDVYPMQIQATDITVTVASTSRNGVTAADEELLTMTIVNEADPDAKITQGSLMGTAAGKIGATAVLSEVASPSVDGVGADKLQLKLAGDSIVYDAGVGFTDSYDRLSFWIYTDDSGAQAFDTTNIKLSTHTAVDAIGDNAADLAGAGSTVDNVWHFVDTALPSGALDSLDQYLAIEIEALDTLAIDDFVILDQVTLYKDKINVDLTANNVNWAVVTPTEATLLVDGTPAAIAYVDLNDVLSSRTGQILFVPTQDYGDIEITGTHTFVVQANTATFMTDDDEASEKLTTKIDLGGVGTAGDIFWNDSLGSVNFCGINSSDKVQVTTTY